MSDQAKAIDAQIDKVDRRFRGVILAIGIAVVAVLLVSAISGVVAAQEARSAAKAAAAQTATNHKTGLQNNEILKEIAATVNRHTATIAGINAIGAAINSIVKAEHIKGVPHFTPVPSSVPLTAPTPKP